MPPSHNDTPTLLHQTTVALSQIQNLLRQATDIVAHLHTHFLHHSHQADPNFRQHFQPLPNPPIHPIRLPSTTSSCDSAPSRPPIRLPAPPSKDSDDTPSTAPTPQPTTTRKRKHLPLPPPNPQADWDAWDGDADCRLIELKGNPRLRPNWLFVARRVGFSVEQCQARWQELKDLQHLQDQQLSSKPPQEDLSQRAPSPLTNTHITSSLTTTTTFTTGFLPFSQDNNPRLHHIDHLQLMCCRCRLLSERLVRTVIRRNLQTRLLAVISCDWFRPRFLSCVPQDKSFDVQRPVFSLHLPSVLAHFLRQKHLPSRRISIAA